MMRQVTIDDDVLALARDVDDPKVEIRSATDAMEALAAGILKSAPARCYVIPVVVEAATDEAAWEAVSSLIPGAGTPDASIEGRYVGPAMEVPAGDEYATEEVILHIDPAAGGPGRFRVQPEQAE